MALETQARILRVLQEREVFRIGGRNARPAEVRVVAATNRPLAAMIARNEFRLDLYHRIADWSVTLPPLRERIEDITHLATHFLATACKRRGLQFGGISVAALQALQEYHWPGNARELEREMERVSLFLGDGELLASDRLQARILRSAPARVDVPSQHEERLSAAERCSIQEALEACGGSVARAAKRLGMGRSTLYRRIEELGIGSA
jgi:transcriptional regulator with PAS, ATPase and Fis domain